MRSHCLVSIKIRKVKTADQAPDTRRPTDDPRILRAGQLTTGGRREVVTDDWLQPDVGGGPPDGVNELDHKSVDVCIAMGLYCICTANQSIFVKAQKAGSVWRQSSPAAMQ